MGGTMFSRAFLKVRALEPSGGERVVASVLKRSSQSLTCHHLLPGVSGSGKECPKGRCGRGRTGRNSPTEDAGERSAGHSESQEAGSECARHSRGAFLSFIERRFASVVKPNSVDSLRQNGRSSFRLSKVFRAKEVLEYQMRNARNKAGGGAGESK
eukprot:scaffold334_cov241-Pinguiococcus_pyrenoidosus.AAC.15